ncbi:S41 family peptidase [Aquimarina algicola]|uniref:Peptidase S41 n=1 Tax=Aquimarina algicola TaxID=2589995 RepID=A0A504J825_9FLAO|nr:S41 family peptidase [Aquimarina algicola]TPN82321.1 peptidase S41 [Aquimarina algicola]
MKYIQYFTLLLLVGGLSTGCFDDNDDVPRESGTSEINSFIWRGMNAFYVYKAGVPNLANDRFSTNQELANFTNSFNSPEEIFEALRTKEVDASSGKPVDDFSFLVDDYVRLEQAFDGVTRNNGMEFGLVQYPDGSANVFGYVRYVLPDTDAETKNIQRGNIFNTIDGTQITTTNFRDLIAPDSYTIGLATFDGSTVTPTGESVALTKVEYTENPVFLSKTIMVGGNPVGYIMYNAFTGDFDDELNIAFGDLKSAGVTDLILDLRYNGGGSTETAKDLASMITGQFNGEIFTTEEWNADRQEQFGSINRFDNVTGNDNDLPINSLNLSRVYILTTRSSASASELVINGLSPYINVIQIGGTTRGKFQASVTLYDTNNFGRQGAEIAGHTYAMQPLVLRSLNSEGVSDYFDGLAPNITIQEDLTNLGVIGDENEPLLKAAIDQIAGTATAASTKIFESSLKNIGDSNMLDINYERMYRDINNE